MVGLERFGVIDVECGMTDLAARKRGVPTVMTVHNHINTCPRSDHLLAGKICQKCVGGREYHCVLNNCRGNLLESVAYAGRNAAVRRLRLMADNVTTVIALNDFMGRRLLTAPGRCVSLRP